MKVYPLWAALLLLMSICANAQDECLNAFAKLFPEPTTDYSLDFGHSVSIHGNFMAVGVPNSDTLSRESGIVYIYEKMGGDWMRIASMVASEAIPDLQLGISVKLTENYLLASASASGGSVYVYRKQPTGWATSTETTIIAVAGTQSFGVAYHHPVDLSEDENTLVVADAMKPHNSNPISIAGSVFVFHKSAGIEWTNNLTPTEIKATTKVIDLGRTGTYVRGNRIFTGTPFTNSGAGNLFVYHDPSGTFGNPVLEATLSGVSVDAGFWMDNMVVTDAGIFVCGRTPDSGMKIYFYQTPSNNSWSNASPSCLIDPDGNAQTLHWDFIRLGTTSTGIIAIFPSGPGTALAKLTEGVNGWCDPSVEIIETRTNLRYGALLATGGSDEVVTGFVSHPWNSFSSTALKAYSKSGSNGWASSLIYSTAKSTRGHAYGHSLAVHNDVMFVGAPSDNSIIDRGGKIYIYHQATPESPWVKTTDLRVPVLTQFGNGLATNGDYLAIGAHQGEPARLLIYKKGIGGWSDPEVLQEIVVPVGDLAEATYGETVVMDERWLLIPFVDWRGFSTMSVAVYELTDGSWSYRQTLETDYIGIFTGTPNGGVAISGSVIVAANRVYELNNEGDWAYTATLSPRDPEGLHFAYPSFEMISNGSNFGRSVAIHENTIAIGAPRRDSESSIWDVGAVYVYTKEAGQKWTSQSETIKLVPNEISASSLFGWDLAFVDEALIIGAPTASTFAKPDPNESPKNNARGKVYIYQSKGISWKESSVIKVLAGETSFRDNFGVEVVYSDGKIFIGSSEEDIATGRTSGSVYITDAPPVIRPVGPICVDDAVIRLTASQAGGTWSGQGITNQTTGDFDPSVAGPGVHEITYVSGICQRVAKVDLLVGSLVHAEIEGPAEVFLCATPFEFDRRLSAVATPNVSYQWQYRPSAEGEFVLIPDESSLDILVTQRGEYRMRLFNNGCEAYSDTLAILDEVVEIAIDPPGEVCGTPEGGMVLTANPEGGTWWGVGVAGNKFSINGIPDATYVLNYQYISALGCVYNDETSVVIKRIAPPSIRREGSLCQTGVVKLALMTTPVADVTYKWQHQPLEGGNYVEVGIGNDYQATTWGWYKLIAEKGYCQTISSAQKIDDTFSAMLTPPEEWSELCHDHGVLLGFEDNEFSTYEWHYSADGQSPILLSENGNSIRPDKTGYYTGTVRRGICTITNPPKFFYIYPKDSVFVPNVFTPNSDGKNDTFSITLLHQDDDPADGDPQDFVHYDVYNRYGRKVFTAPKNQPWIGTDSESGIYFWFGTYHTCQGEPRVIKGIVHLIK